MSVENSEAPEKSMRSDVPKVSDEMFHDLFQTQQSGDWGDSVEASHEPPPLLSPDDEHVEVPEALSHLEGVGFRFMRVPDEHWKVADNNARVFKNCSVVFSVDTVCTSQDILYAFDKAGIDIDFITSVQRRNSSRTWVVSFSSSERKDEALEISSVTICGCEVFLGDAENKTVIVKIYEAPSELPDTVIIGRLSSYGRILSFRRDLLATGMSNGVRTARMRLSRPIPSSMRIVGELVLFYYDSQPRTCRRCGGDGHMANGCKEPRCFNCDKAGHRADECPESELCNVCFSSEHSTARCPFIICSANIQPRVEGQGTASFAAVVSDRPQQVTPVQRVKPANKSKPVEQKERSERSENRRERRDDKGERRSENREVRRDVRDSERDREGDRERGRGRGSGRDYSRRDPDRQRDVPRDCERERDRDRDRELERERRYTEYRARANFHTSDDDSDWISVKRRHRRRDRSRSVLKCIEGNLSTPHIFLRQL